MFKLPPNPFSLKGRSFQPINTTPVPYNAHESLVSRESDSHDEVIAESEVDEAPTPQPRTLHSTPASGDVGERKHKKHKKDEKKDRKSMQEESVVQDSFATTEDSFRTAHEDPSQDIIEASLVLTKLRDHTATTALTPPPTTQSRKRKHFPFDDSYKSKNKKLAADKSSQILASSQVTAGGVEERRLKRARKAEKKRRKEEERLRAKREQQANDDTEDEEPDVETFPTQEPESPPPTQDLLPEPVSSGRPARKPQSKHVEIPATQDARPPKPARTKAVMPTASSQRVRRTTKSPRGKNQLSKEKIIDSSDEDAEDEEAPVVKTELFVASDQETDTEGRAAPREKVKKEYNPKHPRRASRNGPPTLNQGKFSVEEDERIHAFAAQYKQTNGLTDEAFQREMGTKEGRQDITKALKEYGVWGWGREEWQVLRRLGRLYTSLWNSGGKTKGPYTREEDDIMKQQVTIFIRGNQWTEERFQALVEENVPLKRKDKVFTELVLQVIDVLPGRDRTSIIRRIIALYAEHNTQSEWTPKDDQKLRHLVAKHGNKWTKIGDILGRDAAAVRLRHKDYISLGENRGLGKWDAGTSDEMFRIVVSLLRESDWEVDEGFDVDVVSRYIDWGSVSSSLGTRSRLQCREKWKSWERREDFDFERKMKDV